MANNTTLPKTNAATADAPPDGTETLPVPSLPLTPTVTFNQQLAEQFMKNLDAIAAMIPKNDPGRSAEFVRRRQNVSDKALAMVINAVEQTPELQGIGRLDVSSGRDTLQFLEAFRHVENKAEAFLADLRFMKMSRKAELVVDILQVYAIAKALARDPRHAALASLLATMKSEFDRRASRTTAQRIAAKAKAQATDATAKEVA